MSQKIPAERTRVVIPELKKTLDAPVPLALDTFREIMEDSQWDSDTSKPLVDQWFTWLTLG